MKNSREQKTAKRYASYPTKCLMTAVLFSICLNAYAQQWMLFDGEAKTPDGERQIIAPTKVESAFLSLLALEKNPERVKALKLAHKDWLVLRKSHCAATMEVEGKKDPERLMKCYEAFDAQRVEIYNEQRISLLYDIPPEGKLPNKTINITYSERHEINPPAPRSVVVSAHAPVAAVVFDNNRTEIFDLVTGRLLNRIETVETRSSSAACHFFLTPNGRILIGSLYDPRTKLMIWDVRTGELLRRRTLTQDNHLLTSEGRSLIYSDSSSGGSRIGIYDVIRGEATWNVERGRERISLIAMSPEGKYLIVVRDHNIETWELVKTRDQRLSLEMVAAESLTNTNYRPFAIAFANDGKSFYGSLPYGSIVQRRLPDLREMGQLQFPRYRQVLLTEIRNTDIFVMEAVTSDSRRDLFYVDMVRETAQKMPEHIGANSRIAPLLDGRVLLATSHELKTLNPPSKADFARISDIIEVIYYEPIKRLVKENGKTIVPSQIECEKFQIEAIGVYEGSLPSVPSTGDGRRIAGVDVHISRTDAPVKLSLSSYEPVIWRLHVSSDARLSEIYLSGSNQSRVQGIRNVMVSYIGDGYAYKDTDVSGPGYSRGGGRRSLADVVKQKTGCNITRFQGAYKGSLFYIGYITKDLSEKKEIRKYTDEDGRVIYRNY